MNTQQSAASNAESTSQVDPAEYARLLVKYRMPSNSRAILELAATVVPLIALWYLMWRFAQVSYVLTLALAFPTGFFLVRLFMIQHDCGHGSFFTNRRANDWLGRVIGVLTLTPYTYWRSTHALHHASSGCLDKRGLGDIDTLTVCEYRRRSWMGKLKYRFYRHPLVLLGIGPIYLFVFQHRLPFGLMKSGVRPWLSTMGTNASIALCALIAIGALGMADFALVYFPTILIAASIGVWLFFVQHQFEFTSWDSNPRWNLLKAAMHGSSYYDLPPVLHWLTANIGIHHVHHLCSRIPFYRLPTVMRDYPELKEVSRLSLLDSFSCVRLTLWDEKSRRMISFCQAKFVDL